MNTNEIRQFTLVSGDLIIAEVIKYVETKYIIKNLLNIFITEDEYYFNEHYTSHLFPISMERDLNFSSIIIESEPETDVLLNYIKVIKDIEKSSKQSLIENNTLH